ncbi:MAG: MarR family transcriptional regulator [Candidatus Nomurabacteria bacterium]|nr:MarR family transcriptional regulator [Candidatus Nomurabacteria bacterium]
MNNFRNMFFHHMHHINRHSNHLFGQEKILTTLLEKGALTQSELMEIADIKAPSLSETLSKLERRRLIKRDNSSDDKRSNIISLTKNGERLAKGHKKFHDKFEKRMFGSLTEDEKEQLAIILEKMHTNIDDDRRSRFHFRGSHFGLNDFYDDKNDNKKER